VAAVLSIALEVGTAKAE
jgi:magnesium-transporting ATPase (P-type)